MSVVHWKQKVLFSGSYMMLYNAPISILKRILHNYLTPELTPERI